MPEMLGSESGWYTRILVVVSFILLAALSLAICLPGCGGGGTKKEGEGTVTFEDEGGEEEAEVELGAEYVNEEWGYSLSYPEDWEAEEIMQGHGVSLSDPDREEWEVLAWADPDDGKTPEEWLEEQYTMMSSFMEAEREEDTLSSGTFDGAEYVYDYWTMLASDMTTYDADRYYEVFIAASGGNIYFVTGEYPAEDVEEAEAIVVGIMDSLEVFPGEDMTDEDGGDVELGAEFTNEVWGYSLSYPDNWELAELEDGSGCNITSRLNGEELLVNVTVFGAYNFEGETPREKVDDYADISATVSGQPIDRDPSTLTTGTFDGADYAIDYWVSKTEAGAVLYEDVMFAVKGDKIYSLLAAYPADLVDEFDPIISAMIDSFELLD